MGVFLLVLFFVFVIPIPLGVLISLTLREVHIRHPLPLGGTIGPRKQHKPVIEESEKIENITDDVTSYDVPLDDVPLDESADTKISNEKPATDSPTESVSGELTANETVPQEQATEETAAPQTETDVFKDAKSVPEGVPISSVLNAMISEAPVVIPSDFESRIEESAMPLDKFHSQLLDEEDDQYELPAAVREQPSTRIDFARECEGNSDLAGTMSSLATEMLGENFDFNALEQTSADSRQMAALDIREEAGTVQVISSYMLGTAPQFSDFTVPQTILPVFPADWIQEPGKICGWDEGDAEKFCYTEELRPMFVKKNKKDERKL